MVKDANVNTTIAGRIENICAAIADQRVDNRNILLDTLDRIFSKSCYYIELQVKLNGGEFSNSEPDKLANTLDTIRSDTQVINSFCESYELPRLTNDEPDVFAMDLVKEYFDNRIK